MKHRTVLSFSFVAVFLGGCSSNLWDAPSLSEVQPSSQPIANITSFTPVLACIGRRIDQSPMPPIDIFVSPIPDDTTPFDMTGDLVKDATMMATTALDRFGTQKISVVGQNVHSNGHVPIQLVSSFTELNATTRSDALGFGFSIGDFVSDWGADRSWDHLAMDLALIRGGRLMHGMTTSVAISVRGDDGEGNVRVSGEDVSASVSLGRRGQEGVHAAQRVLVELGVAVLMSSLYNVDYRSCLAQPSQDPMRNYQSPTVPTQQEADLTRAATTQYPVPYVSSMAAAMGPVVSGSGASCQTYSQPPGISDRDRAGDWKILWNGPCVNGVANGAGVLTWLYSGQVHSYVSGTMVRGSWVGNGWVRWADRSEFVGDLTGRESGVYQTRSGAFSARLKLSSGQLITGHQIPQGQAVIDGRRGVPRGY